VNHKVDRQTPRFDVQLIFEEIGIALDDNQYRDAISLIDMYHVYLRKRQVSPLFFFVHVFLTVLHASPSMGGTVLQMNNSLLILQKHD